MPADLNGDMKPYWDKVYRFPWARTEAQDEERRILPDLVHRMWGNGSVHLDTDTLDIDKYENDRHVMTWFARIVSGYVLRERYGSEEKALWAVVHTYFDGEWNIWKKDVHGPFRSFNAAEDFMAEQPDVEDPRDIHGYGGWSLTRMTPEVEK